MLLGVIIIVLLSVIGIINVVLAEKLNRIEIMLDSFTKHYGYFFIPDESIRK